LMVVRMMVMRVFVGGGGGAHGVVLSSEFKVQS
jgi:hypothetical protein